MINTFFFNNWKLPENWISNTQSFFHGLKYLKQRAFRGYADCDLWSIDCYLCEIMPKMLKRLQETTHGYPIGFTEETWDQALDKMIEGFEAAKRIIDDEYMDKVQPDWYKKIMTMDKANKFDEPIFTVESNKKALEMIKADEELFKTSMKIFVDNYFGLWD